jgi:hypothetical protein
MVAWTSENKNCPAVPQIGKVQKNKKRTAYFFKRLARLQYIEERAKVLPRVLGIVCCKADYENYVWPNSSLGSKICFRELKQVFWFVAAVIGPYLLLVKGGW